MCPQSDVIPTNFQIDSLLLNLVSEEITINTGKPYDPKYRTGKQLHEEIPLVYRQYDTNNSRLSDFLDYCVPTNDLKSPVASERISNDETEPRNLDLFILLLFDETRTYLLVSNVCSMLETRFGNFVLASCTLESIVQPIVGSSLLPYKSVTPWLAAEETALSGNFSKGSHHGQRQE